MLHLEKTDAKNEGYRYYHEVARWKVIHETGEKLGEIWKGSDTHGKFVWMIHPDDFPEAFPDPSVISGYGRTTKKNSVAFLEDWRANKSHDIILDDHHLHCAKNTAGRMTYYVAAPNPKNWFVIGVHYEATTRGMSFAGWQSHATCRGFTLFMSAAASSAEAVRGAFCEVTRTLEPTELAVERMMYRRSAMSARLVRLYGSLIDLEKEIVPGLFPFAVEQPDGSYRAGPVPGPALYHLSRTSPSLWSVRLASTGKDILSGSLQDMLRTIGVCRVITQEELAPYLKQP